jgi:hypothetical protein
MPRNGSRNGGGAVGGLGPRNGAARGQEPRNKRQPTSNKKESEEGKNGLVGAQTMMMAKQNEANKAQSGAKTTTNLTAMVAAYLVMGISR